MKTSTISLTSGKRFVVCSTIFFFLLFTIRLDAQPVSDNNGQTATASNVATLTLSNFSVPANNDRLLVVCVANSANAASPALMFGSTSMTPANTKEYSGLRATMYYVVLGSGSATSADITATGSNIYRMVAASFHNVKQSNPINGMPNGNILAGATSNTLAVSSTPDDLVCDCISHYAPGFTGFTVNAGQTQIAQSALTPGLSIGLAMSTKTGATPSVNMTWALNGNTASGLGVHLGGSLKSATCPAAAGPVWYVDAAAATGGTGASWDCAFQNVQDAIDAASSGHEIWVKTGTYLPTQDPFGNTSPADPRNKTFYLKNGVALYGGFAGTETMRSQRNWTTNVTTFSGDIGMAGDNTDNCYRVITSVSDANTTVVDGFTVSDGNRTGGGILTIETLLVAYGSGMSNKNSFVSVKNCRFINNIGNGITNDAASPSFTDCLFSGNTSTNGYGAGLYNINASSPVLTNCIISNNSAVNGGGGVANWNNSNAVLTNCLISGNYGATGGGILNSDCSPVFMNCTISGNRCVSGGAFYSQSSASPVLTNCIIWNNRIGSTTGSADASLTNLSSTPVISYSLIQNHDPAGTGNLNGITNAALSNYPNFVTPLDPTTAPSATGDFHIQAYSPVANVGTGTGAPATDLFGNARPFGAAADLGVHELQSANTAPCPASGAIWYVDGSAAPGGTGTSWDCAFQHVQDAIDAASSGHEIWVKAGTYLPTKDPFGNASPADPRDKTFYLKNGVALYGGFAGTETMRSQRLPAVNVTIFSGDIGLSNDMTDNCYHVVLSVNDDSTTVLDGFTVEKGNANGSGTIVVESRTNFRQRGGGMHIQTSPMTVTNCIFTNNATSHYGGGLLNSQGNGNITDCTFSNNTALFGAGLANNFAATPILTNCTFSMNTAGEDGGGIYDVSSFPKASPTLIGCTFNNNTAANNGGGYFANASDPSLTNCIFSGNTASETSGGGLRGYESAVVLSGCTFSNNTANDFGGGISGSNCTFTLTNSAFNDNSASNGGGINASSGSITLNNCSFSSNSASTNGGGLRVASDATVSFSNCTLTGNSASANGGGLYNNVTAITLTNCLLSGNSANSGGALYNASSSQLALTNCTISGNQSTTSGGGIRNVDSNPSLTNCIIWNNRSANTTGSADASLSGTGVPVITYSLIQNHDPAGTGNLNGIPNASNSNYPNFETPLDPATAPSTSGDFHIQSFSPVANVGNNAVAPANDLFGNSRPYGTIVDFGVHELQSANCPPAANAGPDQTSAATCGTTHAALSAILPAGSSGAWSVFSGTGGNFDNANSPTAEFTGTAGMAYVLRWTISTTDCPDVTDDINVTFNQNPTTANAGPDQTGASTCGLTTVTLAANTPTVGTGAWSIVNGTGGSFGNAGSPTSSFTGIAGNSYTLRWTISNAPCAASTDEVAITFNQNPTTANAGPDQTGASTCGLTTVTLAANTPAVGTGAWSIVNGTGGSFGNAGSPTSSFTGIAGNSYTLRWTISNAPCAASTDEVAITFNQNPTTANAGPDQTGASTCGLTTVTLAANTPAVGTGAWSIVNGTGGSFGNAGSPTSSFSGIAGNSYTLRWTISNAPCAASTDDVAIIFNQIPVVNCPSDLTVHFADPAFALGGATPTGGTYSGAGVSGGMFTPSAAGGGVHTITYNYTDNNGCSGSCTFTITVNSSVACPSNSVVCLSDPAFALSGGTPAGGTYSGAGVSAGMFNPSVAGAGMHTITYSNGGMCNFSISVNALPTTANAGLDQTGASTCGLTTVTLVANTPTVGTGAWSIVNGTGGSFGDANSPTSSFTGIAGNSYTLRWTISNAPCAASADEVVIIFNQTPVVNCPSDLTVHYADPAFALSGATPTGGTYSGAGVNGGMFTPSVAGGGMHTITYNYTDNNGCSGSCTFMITVNSSVSCPSNSVVCLSDPAFALSGGTPAGGTYSGTGVNGGIFNPTVAGAGMHTITYSNGGSCNFIITVNPLPTTANAGPDQTGASTCGLTSITLAANTPAVGTGAWSIVNGTGGSFGNANSPTSSFTGIAGNSYTLRWTISNAPCAASTDEVLVTFNQNPVVMNCPQNLTVCINSSSVNLSDGIPSGGVFSGNGVTGHVFEPASAGIGIHMITYTYTTPNGCSETCNFEITVGSESTLDIVYNSSYCTQDPGPVIGVAGSLNGVNYQLQNSNGQNLGAPVAGNGNTIYFGAYSNGLYKVVSSGGACVYSGMANIQATTMTCDIVVPNFCACDSPDERAAVTAQVTAPAGQTWTVKAVIGLYAPSSPPAPGALVPLPVGAPLVYSGPNTYTLDALRLTTKGFWVRVTNGATDLDVAVGNAAW